MRILAALLLAVLVAACLDRGAPDDGTPPGPPTASGRVPVAPDASSFHGAIVNDHGLGATGHVGHQVPELHAHQVGLRLVAFSGLDEGLMVPGAGFTELHVVGGLAVVSSLTGARGATLVNVTDPAAPRVLAHITNLDDNWDARLSDDLQYLFLGCQGSSAFDCTGVQTGGEGGPGTTGGGACVPLTTCPGGIAVYGIADPTAPVFLGYLPMGFTHNLYTWQVNAVHYFANAVGNIAAFDPEANTFDLASSEIQGVHDVHVQKHPITGQWLLYTGGGEQSGMTIWDVDDPLVPVLIGSAAGPPGMWHEQTPMPCLIAGRHITIGAGESGGGIPQPVAVVDTTDPTAPVVLGEWLLPGADAITAQQSYRFSLHNIDGNCDGQVAVGHYHAGVWVFDVSTPERMADPPTIAYYMPHERPVSGIAWSPVVTAPIGALVSADTPNVWTAQWSDDGSHLLVPDMTTGLYVLEPTWEFVAV